MISQNQHHRTAKTATRVTRNTRRALASGTNAGTGSSHAKNVGTALGADSADNRMTLQHDLKPNQTKAASIAETAVAGLAGNAVITRTLSAIPFGDDVELTECLKAIQATSSRVNAGDLRDSEALLMAQASALNAAFVRFTLLAQLNFGQYLDAAERYMRLALKAQSQCRATLETLAAIKNPPTVFARQANIANGPQQVNNGVPPPARSDRYARGQNVEFQKTELLEAHGERLDSGTAGTAGEAHTHVEAVGALHRPPDA